MRLQFGVVGATLQKRVLIVTNLFPPHVIGGAEIVALRQAQGLARRGCDVVVMAGGLPSDTFPPGELRLEEVGGLTVYRLALRSLDADQNFHWPAATRRFLSIVAAHRPDIVHFHNITGLGVDLIPRAKRSGATTIVTLHDHWGFCFKNTRLRNDTKICDDAEQCGVCRPRIRVRRDTDAPIRLRRDYVAWCLGQADHLVSPSRYLAEAYQWSGFSPHPVQPLTNGVDLDVVRLREKPASTCVEFVCFAYLGEHKGILVLLDAAERLSKMPALVGRWRLTIAGHGHLAPRLQADIEAGRFGSAVVHAGRLDHGAALELMGRSHVAVLPSIWPENEPVTMLEAIASGTAQIASRLGGNLELVHDGSTGLLFEPGNSADLAAAMVRFVEDPALADRFGRANGARREAYDANATLDRLIALYEIRSGSSATEEMIVLCAGNPPARLDLMLHRFHVGEDGPHRIRFIWHEWAPEQAWRQARLLWLWGDGTDDDLALSLQALRRGIPVLAPERSRLALLAQEPVGLGTYDSLLDALASIAALQDAPALPKEDGAAAARQLVGVVARSVFTLSA